VKRRVALLVGFVLLCAGCTSKTNPALIGSPPGSVAPSAQPRTGLSIRITSTAFAPNGNIPVKYTCQGAGVSPPLQWTNIPPEAKELALVVIDPDAPGGQPFVHWVLFHMSPTTTGVAEGSVPAGARQAKGSTGKAGYLGPCPPAGPAHHYRFRLWTLSSPLNLPDGAPTAEARSAIQSAGLTFGELVGLYARR